MSITSKYLDSYFMELYRAEFCDIIGSLRLTLYHNLCDSNNNNNNNNDNNLLVLSVSTYHEPINDFLRLRKSQAQDKFQLQKEEHNQNSLRG